MEAAVKPRGVLILLRGEPGSGKSSVAELFADAVCYAADDFFVHFNFGRFDARLLGAAHKWCQDAVKRQMLFGGNTIVVHNTNTTNQEMEPYLKLAEEWDYRVHVLRVESGLSIEELAARNVHNVPETTIKKMSLRFQPYKKEGAK